MSELGSWTFVTEYGLTSNILSSNDLHLRRIEDIRNQDLKSTPGKTFAYSWACISFLTDNKIDPQLWRTDQHHSLISQE